MPEPQQPKRGGGGRGREGGREGGRGGGAEGVGVGGWVGGSGVPAQLVPLPAQLGRSAREGVRGAVCMKILAFC